MKIKYIEEKRSFLRLTSLRLYLDKPDNLGILNYLQLKRIVKFHVIICKQRRSTYDYQFRRSLELIDINVRILSEKAIALLLRRTYTLILKVKGLELLVTKDRDGFVELRKLELLSGDYKYLVAKSLMLSVNCSANAIGNGPSKVLKNLESIKLNNLPNFIGICDADMFLAGFFSQLRELKLCMLNKMRHLWIGPIWPPSLCNLRMLEMEDCGEMEYLFPHCVLKCLVQLHDLKIGKCHKLKAVVGGQEEGNLDEQVREISQLKHLNLSALEEFESFVFHSIPGSLLNQVSLPALETLQINRVKGSPMLAWGSQMAIGSLQKCRAIILSGSENLMCFTTPQSVRFLEDLQQLRITRYPLSVVFDFTGLNITAGEDAVLARLDFLLLVDIGNLIHVWQSVPEGLGAFQSLRVIEISNCGGMKYLFPAHVAKMLASLEELTIHYCKSIQEIMGEGEEEVSQVFVFHKLRQISLRDLKVLQSFCSKKDYELIFPSLTKLEIMECPQLRKFCSGKLTAPILHNVVSGKDPVLPMDLKGLAASSSGPSAELVEEWHSL